MKEVIFYLLIIGAGTGGELCVSRAMKAVGEVKDFRPAALLGVASRALRVPWMWVGLSLMGTAFFALLAVLSIENVSSGHGTQLRWRRVGREILPRRTGHTAKVDGRASGLRRRCFGDHRPAVTWADQSRI
jgi:hypothetical protein